MYINAFDRRFFSQTAPLPVRQGRHGQELTLTTSGQKETEEKAFNIIISWHQGRGQENAHCTQVLGKEQHCSALILSLTSIT